MKKLIIFYLLLLFVGCSSTQETETSTESYSDLKQMISSAFKTLSTDNKNEYSALSKIEYAMSKDSKLSQDKELREEASALFNKYKKTISCTIKIEEPQENSFVMEGFQSPLSLQADCPGETEVDVLLVSENQVKFESPNSGSDSDIIVRNKKDEKTPFHVSALSTKSSENGILFKPVDRFTPRTLAALKKFGADATVQASFVPEKYMVLSKPMAYSRNYQAQGSRFYSPDSVTINTVKSKNMEISVTSRGDFSMGGEKDGEAFDLTFGHPNGAYYDGLGSSVTSISIDGEIYRFSNLENIKTVAANETEIIVEGKVPQKNFIVRLIASKRQGNDNTFVVRYRVINQTDSTANIGIRTLLDTWAGTNDGVPFINSAATEKEMPIRENEMRISPSMSPVWETFDPNGDGVVYLRNVMIGDGLVAPDEIAFANWPNAFKSEWSYSISNDRSVTGDSAIISWWNPVKVDKGKSFDIATEYSYVKKTGGVNLQLTDSEKGTALLSIERKNDSIEPITYTYSLQSSPGKILSNGELEFIVNPEERLTKVIPVTIAGNGQIEVIVKEKSGAESKDFKFNFNLTGKGASPDIWSQKKYPITYTDSKSGMKLKGIVINEDTKAEIGSTILSEEKLSSGKSMYSGSVDLGSFSGRAGVQIEEIEDKPKVSFDELPPPPGMGLAAEEAFSVLDASFKPIGKIVSDGPSKYEIELVTGAAPEMDQIVYVADSQKRIVAKLKIHEVGTTRAAAVFQESFVTDLKQGMEINSKD